MVALRRTVDLRELAVAPVVVAAVHDHAAHGRAVSVDPLRRRIDDNVGTPFEGVAEVSRRTERVVHYQRHVASAGHGAQPLQVGHVAGRVTHALDVEGLRTVVDERFERLGALVRGDAHLDAHVAQRDAELVVGTAVEQRGGDDVVAPGGQREHRDEDRRHARRYGQGPHGSVERRDALLVGCRGGVLQPGVDVAGFAQLEEPGGMVATAETVGGRGTDRHAAGSGLPVLGQPGMDLQGLESVIFRFHILFLSVSQKSPASQGSRTLFRTRRSYARPERLRIDIIDIIGIIGIASGGCRNPYVALRFIIGETSTTQI